MAALCYRQRSKQPLRRRVMVPAARRRRPLQGVDRGMIRPVLRLMCATLLALPTLLVAGAAPDDATQTAAAKIRRPHLQGRSVVAAGDAEQLDSRRGDRRLRRRARSRVGDAPARDVDRGGNVADPEAADRDVLSGGADGAGVRPVGQDRPGLGPPDRRHQRLSAQPARHLRRPQQLRLDRHLHAPPRDEVHARGQARDDDRHLRQESPAATTRRCSAARPASGSIRRATKCSSPTATATAA